MSSFNKEELQKQKILFTCTLFVIRLQRLLHCVTRARQRDVLRDTTQPVAGAGRGELATLFQYSASTGGADEPSACGLQLLSHNSKLLNPFSVAKG
jgi:hypothetical protein